MDCLDNDERLCFYVYRKTIGRILFEKIVIKNKYRKEKGMFRKDTYIKTLDKKVWLSSPTMHEEEMTFVEEAFRSNWVSTVGENIDKLEAMAAEYVGVKYAVALSSGTAALHLCMKLAGERSHPGSMTGGALRGQHVFCSDLTFAATVNPVIYEGGCPVFIDTERDSWNMSPQALQRAFEQFPEVRIVVLSHLYGAPAKMEEILAICEEHHAWLVEDAAEALGASIGSRRCGSFGTYHVVSLNGNKIVTGSSGGLFLTDSWQDAQCVRKWSTQAREAAPWYQHRELGYNYRMSNVIAGIARGNFLHIEEHIARKKQIYKKYEEGLRDLPVTLNPIGEGESNYWLSCLLIDKAAMCRQVRSEDQALYLGEHGKTCPTEILEVLMEHHAEGRPIWKPMHMQTIYQMCPFVSVEGDVSADIFARGLCLPSDIKMSEEEQEVILDIIRHCFD